MSVVVLYPGYLTGPSHMNLLKKRLVAHGHAVYDWSAGVNTGMSSNLFDMLNHQLNKLHDSHREPITIVGHSLGGSIARAMCATAIVDIEHVITIGSPINNIRDTLAEFKAASDMRNGKITTEAEWEEYLDMASYKPKTKCTSIWSIEDKVVPWKQSLIDSEDGNNIIVEGKHLKLPRLQKVQDVVAQLLVADLPCTVYNIRT